MIKTINEIKKLNASRLISIASVRNGDANKIYYHFSFDKKSEIGQFILDVPKNEEVETIVSLFENAALLEAEITELFGIAFKGNPYSGKRLFQAEDGGKKCTPPFIQ